jgi:2'-5' RNA ligase
MTASNQEPHETSTVEARPVRVFAGLKIDGQIARDLTRFVQEMLKEPEVRAVAADDVHLTLVPPWTENATSEAIETLAAVAGRFAAFVLTIQHAGYGPERRWPRLLWADCAMVDELTALRAALLSAYGQTDEKPFRPHITLARIRGNGRAIAKRHPIDQPLALSQWVKSIELFQSPAPGERGYKILASAGLRDPVPKS